ncbi:MAG: hypothetical protein DRJ02_09630, partial [Bacteroidetes bacterium]
MKKFLLLTIVGLIPFFGITQQPLKEVKLKNTDGQKDAGQRDLRPVGQTMEVQTAKYFDISKPLREMTPIKDNDYRGWKDGIVKNGFRYLTGNGPVGPVNDPVWQKEQGTRGGSGSRGLLQNFDGANNGDNTSGVAPPDTQGDVGPNHYVQMVNNVTEIFDKNGNTLWGPTNSSAFWDGFTGSWTGTNDGDPIVLYDQQADRWLVSQFAVNTSDNTQWELIAISTPPDPTGTYYRYAFQFTDMPDYPKLGIWPDGYYMAANRFTVSGGSYNGTYAAVLERSEMLTGNSARMLLFSNGTLTSDPYSMLPSDCDGSFPSTGTPNYFCWDTDDDTWGASDRVKVWAFNTDWVTTSNSTFTEVASLTPSAFNSSFSASEAIDQPGTTQDLGTLADRMMFRAQYRTFAGHESIVISRTVNMGSDHAGVRWYELRKTTGTWGIYQQGTYAPDGDSRWMSSIAMNGVGDIALGYSVSGSSTYPSIRYTGRLAGDPLNTLTITETSIFSGTASQTGVGRWGDYSMMSVDPTDDFTFWYTQEYTSGSWNWRTRIASFDFPVAVAPSITSISPSSLYEDRGKQITITGADMLGCSFDIGGVSGSIVSNDGSTAVVNFPSANYVNGTLTVTNAAGSDTWSVTVGARNTIPVDASTGSNTDIHQTIDGAVDGLAAWYGSTAFNLGDLPGTKTIEVSAGTYSESVTLDANLNPTSANPLIIAPASGAVPDVDASGQSYGFNLNSVDYVELKGFTVHDASLDNILVQGNNGTIHFNKCYNAGNAGVKIETGTNNTVTNNLCYANDKYGVHFNSSSNTLKNNTLTDNGSNYSPPEQILLDEGFEGTFLPAGWQQYGNGANSWVQGYFTGPIAGPDGSSLYAIHEWDANYIERSLETNGVNLNGYATASLEYYIYHNGTWGEIIYAEISTDGGGASGTWTTLRTHDTNYGGWSSLQTIDLTSYVNNTIHIRFRYVQTDGNSGAVDVVKIKATPSPVNTGAGLYVQSGTGTTVQNNILQAKAGNDAYYALITESGITVNSDYNTYYTTNTNLFDYNGTVGNTGPMGANDVNSDPKFVGSGDYHIFSTNGSYHGGTWPPLTASGGTWTNDASDSPGLDSGNPSDDYSNEPQSGGRINQGAYGNTAQASKSGTCTYPSTQASAFTSTAAVQSINIGWTRGNGDAVLVVARDGSAVNQDPSDGTTYTANAAFGSGTQIGTGNYVVYDGTGTSVNITGLTSGNTYHFAVYEYSSSGHCYLTPALTGNSTTLTPTVFAGANATICEGNTYTISDATASNYTSLAWTTSGTGTFNDATTLNPIYTPSSADITNGSVTLTLTAQPGSVSDAMVLTITPAATASAGSDAEVCEGSDYTLSGSATNYNTVTWNSGGDGTFDDIHLLTATYTPGSTDITNGTVTLTLTATGNGSCGDATDDMILTITPAATADAGSDGETC